MSGQELIVAAVIAGSAAYVLRTLMRSLRRSGCGTGCGKCARTSPPEVKREGNHVSIITHGKMILPTSKL